MNGARGKTSRRTARTPPEAPTRRAKDDRRGRSRMHRPAVTRRGQRRTWTRRTTTRSSESSPQSEEEASPRPAPSRPGTSPRRPVWSTGRLSRSSSSSPRNRRFPTPTWSTMPRSRSLCGARSTPQSRARAGQASPRSRPSRHGWDGSSQRHERKPPHWCSPSILGRSGANLTNGPRRVSSWRDSTNDTKPPWPRASSAHAWR